MPKVLEAYERDMLWRFVWDALAEHGGCDSWGSAEQRRVTLEWHAAGRPVGIAEYILVHANKAPVTVPTT